MRLNGEFMVFNKSVLVCRLKRRSYGVLPIYDVVITHRNRRMQSGRVIKLGFFNLSPAGQSFFLDLEGLAF